MEAARVCVGVSALGMGRRGGYAPGSVSPGVGSETRRPRTTALPGYSEDERGKGIMRVTVSAQWRGVRERVASRAVYGVAGPLSANSGADPDRPQEPHRISRIEDRALTMALRSSGAMVSILDLSRCLATART